MKTRVLLAVAALLAIGAAGRSDDWPQWRGPLGQGTTSTENLPPVAGSSSLGVRWKTPIPGDGVSSPIVCQGRVYVTTAYEGSERHPWDAPAFWAIAVLACMVVFGALVQLPGAWRSLTRHTVRGTALALWTIAAVGAVLVVLAKPRWFWRFADPWTGTTLAPAELAWVESLHGRSAAVAVCLSLAIVFVALLGKRAEGASTPTAWLRFLTIVVVAASGIALGAMNLRPDWFFEPSQPWLAWLVAGGIGLFALAGSVDWLGPFGRRSLFAVAAACGVAGWLFGGVPGDEFGHPLGLLNRIAYLVPALMVLAFHAWAALTQIAPIRGSAILFTLTGALAVVAFVRTNYLHAQTGIVRAVVCLDADSGEVVWTAPVYLAAAEKRHSLNSLATPTPACDGERIYAYFGSGLAALDLRGRVVWLKRDAEFASRIRYGAGSSVVLARDRIVIYRDSEFMGHGHHLDDDIRKQEGRRATALTAYDARTGVEIWTASPEFSHDSYMTPLLWTRDERSELVIATWKTVAGIDVRDGSLVWSHPYPMCQVVPSPAVSGDVLFLTGGNSLTCPLVAVRAPGATAPAKSVWFNAKVGGNIVSPVAWKGLLFSANDDGILRCLDGDSGRIHWTKRLGGRCLASLVAGDDKLYVLERDGTLRVYSADVAGTEIATLYLDEKCSATPALAAGAVFVRTSSGVRRIDSGR